MCELRAVSRGKVDKAALCRCSAAFAAARDATRDHYPLPTLLCDLIFVASRAGNYRGQGEVSQSPKREVIEDSTKDTVSHFCEELKGGGMGIEKKTDRSDLKRQLRR
jgi:hypothetical protein